MQTCGISGGGKPLLHGLVKQALRVGVVQRHGAVAGAAFGWAAGQLLPGSATCWLADGQLMSLGVEVVGVQVGDLAAA